MLKILRKSKVSKVKIDKAKMTKRQHTNYAGNL